MNTYPIPKTLYYTSAAAYGSTTINAFDNALLKAGIGNLNLMRVSSIMPPGARVEKLNPQIYPPVKFPLGILMPTVYTCRTSNVFGGTLASAIGIGIPKDKSLNGVIFETNIEGSKEEAYLIVKNMVEEGFSVRGYELESVIITTSEITVRSKVGCVLSAVVMLP